MPITQAVCNTFKQEVLDGLHDFGTSPNTFKIALYTNSATLGASTTIYTTSGECPATGNYVAGGNTLTGTSLTLSGSTAIVDFADSQWTSSTITARGALIYNSTNGNRAVMVLDFGSDKSSSSSTFTIIFPTPDATNGLLRLA